MLEERVAPARYVRQTFVHHMFTPHVQTVASIFALLNDYRLSIGKPTLGFLNPVCPSILPRYSYSYENIRYYIRIPRFSMTFWLAIMQAVEPMVSMVCSGFTFSNLVFNVLLAVAGWDPVTGLGSPNFRKLRAIVWSYAGTSVVCLIEMARINSI